MNKTENLRKSGQVESKGMRPEKRFKNGRKTAVICAAALMAVGTAAASAAYWTDQKSMKVEVTTSDIGIQYKNETTGMEGSVFLPGEKKPFSFEVKNTGGVSVDIKPVITVTSEKEMQRGGNEYLLVNSDGTQLTGFTAAYYDDQGQAVADAEGAAFHKIVYTLAGERTLAGSQQADAALDGTDQTSESFSYQLKLSENTRNAFIGDKTSVDISTYAIQHRNSEGRQAKWFESTEKR